jgi:hypothetical protein
MSAQGLWLMLGLVMWNKPRVEALKKSSPSRNAARVGLAMKPSLSDGLESLELRIRKISEWDARMKWHVGISGEC